jgi:lipid-A-disaccharide synthase
MSHTPLIFLIAGEASGDQLGADLMASVNRIRDVSFAGIGGEAMTAQGLQSLFPMEELSVLGVLEIIRHLPRLWGRLKFTVKTIESLKPDVVITIDAPEFSFRVMKRLHKLSHRPRLIHYVAPTVWAWRPGRARKVSKILDQLLCLYPFEPPYFERYGLKTTFVGHPVARKTISSGLLGSPHELKQERLDCFAPMGLAMLVPAKSGEPPVPRLKAGAKDCEVPQEPKQSRKITIAKRDPNLLCVLPGSRPSEVETLLLIFKQTVGLLKKGIPDLKVIIPTVPSVESLVHRGVRNWSVDVEIVVGDSERNRAFQKASAALAASGTVALQLSAAGLPFVIAYKMNKVNEWIARALIKTPWACMVNILLAFQKLGPHFVLTPQAKTLIPSPWIPEFLQEDCTPEKLAPALLSLLKDKTIRSRQSEAMKEAISLLRAPSDSAEKAVLREITKYNVNST